LAYCAPFSTNLECWRTV